ncbi:MAG: phosphoribosyltransferase family protein [Candidatus Kerfeldbacteria bacterium]
MTFADRHDAGRQLAEKLNHYAGNPDCLIAAIPRGGVVLGYELAKKLKLPLDVIVTKKIGAPGNPEYAIGSIDTDGNVAFDNDVLTALGITPGDLKVEIADLQEQAREKERMMREGRAVQQVKGKTVILVDDGIATGYTMQAAIQSLRANSAAKVVVAVPVSSIDAAKRLRKIVDEFVVLDTPDQFMSVGQFYESFDQTTYPEAKKLMDEANGAS